MRNVTLKFILIGAVITAALSGCAPSDDRPDSARIVNPSIVASNEIAAADAKSTAPGAARFVERSATMAMNVKDVEKASSEIDTIVEDAAGYIEQSSFTSQPNQPTVANISLRVPESLFSATTSKLAALGQVTHKTVTADDVTAQIAAIQGQIKREEKTNPDKTFANQLKDQKRQLLESARFARISVQIQVDPALLVEAEKSKWSSEQLKDATNAFQESMKLVASGFLWLLALSPFWIVPVIAGLVWLKFRKKPTAPTPAPPVTATES